MAQTIAEYQPPVVAKDGSSWAARAATRRIDSHWECWIEFVPATHGQPIHTSSESTQPDLRAAKYWASGITPAYLEGALERALVWPTVAVSDVGPAAFDSPAAPVEYKSVPRSRPHPLLDPFEVYAQGERLLTGQLDALETSHLRDIAEAYGLLDGDSAGQLERVALIAKIVEAVREDATAIR